MIDSKDKNRSLKYNIFLLDNDDKDKKKQLTSNISNTLLKIAFPFLHLTKISNKVEEIQKTKINNFKLFELVNEYESYKFWGNTIFKAYILGEVFLAWNQVKMMGQYKKNTWIIRMIVIIYAFSWTGLYKFSQIENKINY